MHLVLKIILIFLACLVVSLLVLVGFYIWLNKTNGEIISSGESRRYLVYVPPTYDPSKPTPLILSFHGFIEWPAHQRDLSHWNELADENGFIVVYPSGTGFPLRWQTDTQISGGTDLLVDVQFVSDLIDQLESEYNIDPTRIYANGMSNGGGMTFLLACQLSDRIAAIGGVAGAYMTPWDECKPSRPVPGIFFHGTEDSIVPYTGGVYARAHTFFPVIPEWVGQWASNNNCDPEPEEIQRENDVIGEIYSNCDSGTQVILYTILGGGHTWPGGKPLPEFITGPTTQTIDATRIMWEFYSQHRIK